MSELSSPLGLIAGNGGFPLEFAANAKRRGIDLVVLAHHGETDPKIEDLARRCVWIHAGQVGRIVRVLRREGVRQAAMVGGLRRTRLFFGLRPDLKGLALIAKLAGRKDDQVLRAFAAELGRNGIEVVPASCLLERSVPGRGTMTRRPLSEMEARDARLGWEAAKAIGALDIGQTVVVFQGTVIAVEAVEGTDAAIARAGALTGTDCGSAESRRGCGLVVVKVLKPGQDTRFDLPAAGPDTIAAMQRAGATALVLEAGKCVMLNPQETVEAADAGGVALCAAAGVEDLQGG